MNENKELLKDIRLGIKKLFEIFKGDKEKRKKLLSKIDELKETYRDKKEITEHLDRIKESVEKNNLKLPKEFKVKVSNQVKIPKEVEIKKPSWIFDFKSIASDLISYLRSALRQTFIVKVQQTKNPKDYLNVRLTNGKEFDPSLGGGAMAAFGTPDWVSTGAKQDTANSHLNNIKNNQTNNSQTTKIVDINGKPVNLSQSPDGTWALDVVVSDTKIDIINLSLIQETAISTTIATSQNAGDTTITVVDGSDFAVGEYLTIQQGNNLLDNHFEVTAKPDTNEITLDMPIDIALDDTAVVKKVLDSMNVNGSLASPQIFRLKPPEDEVWHITRLLFTMEDDVAMDDGKFGGLTALTNGVVFRRFNDGVYTTFANFKSNRKFMDSMYDVEYNPKAPAGTYGLRGRWTLTKAGVVIRLDGSTNDELQVLVQDDISGLLGMHITAQGHKESS